MYNMMELSFRQFSKLPMDGDHVIIGIKPAQQILMLSNNFSTVLDIFYIYLTGPHSII